MAERETRTIALDCQSGITNLLVTATSEGCCVKDFLNSRDVKHVRDRFNQWAGNLGALQPFNSLLSLEHRLRNAPWVKESIQQSLSDLHRSLQAATDIALGKRPNRVTRLPVVGSDVDPSEYGLYPSESDSSSVSSSGSEIAADHTSEIQELLSAVRIEIDSLFKASIFIRKNASRDRRLRARTEDLFDNCADIVHVKDRFPLLKNNTTLVPRLGEANARRRQYFKYLRGHSERLATVPDNLDNVKAQARPGVVGAEVAVTVLIGETKPSLLADTAATTFVADEAAKDRMLKVSAASKVMSVVSFATSVAETSEKDLLFPPVPTEGKHGELFDCPYCCMSIKLKLERLEDHWKTHVIQDLESYICTFSFCSLDTFQSQQAWFEHELLVHRSRWICPECSISFGSSDNLEGHVSHNHSGLISKQQLPAFIEQSRRPVDSIQPSECPFCDDPWAEVDAGVASSEEEIVVSPDHFRRHLGKHLQQVALFSLPRLPTEHGSQSLGTMNVGEVPDRDAISEAWNYLGHGWSIVSRKWTTFVTLAYFLALYRAQGRHKGRYTLHTAAVYNNVEKAQLLLDEGADINSRSRSDSTPLHIASNYGRERLVQLLLDQGADINLRDGDHETALQKASYKPHEKIIQLLLGHDADVSARDGRWGNALQIASYKGHVKTIELLLDHGVDVNLKVQTESYSNALQAAVYGGQERAMQLLLEHEAKIDLEDEGWENVLDSAVSSGHEKVFQVLLSQSVIVTSHFQREYSARILLSAVQRGEEKIVQVLLGHGADVNSEIDTWGSLLNLAAYMGHEKIVQLLLDQDAEINLQDKKRGDVMRSAAHSGNEKVIQILLTHGLKIDDRYKGGYEVDGTALQEAASKGHTKLVQFLLEKGANVNAQGKPYNSALQAAALRGFDQIVELLLNHGADVNAQGDGYQDALQAAACEGHDQVVELLLSHGADVDIQGGPYGNALQAASSRGHGNIKQRLLDSGADAKAKGADYAFITVTILGTDHYILLRLFDTVYQFKKRLINDVPSVLEMIKTNSTDLVRLVLDDKTLEDECQFCMEAGLKEGSHVFCHLESQPSINKEAQT